MQRPVSKIGRSMNNALLYLGGLLAVTLAALFAVPHFIDWNGYRGVFEEEASKVLGRGVRVGGAVNVRFLPTPYVRFDKVRLEDPTGQTGEPFFRIESFAMRLSGPALLRGVLEANEIELHRPVLTLALDGKGGGNWTSMQIKPGALPFVPRDVALRSVKVIDGVVGLFNSQSQPIARAEAVNGEFSAEALKGPFKFKGQSKWSGENHDIKFATTEPAADGTFQLRASLRSATSAAAYTLDARVEQIASAPRLVGELTGKLPIPGSGAAASLSLKAADPVTPAPATSNSATSAPAPSDPTPSGQMTSVAVNNADGLTMDLKSRIEATTAGATIDDIALALENAAEPQLLTGTAKTTWGAASRLDVVLVSKWLDLDRLAGAGQESATFVKINQLGLSLLRGLAGEGAAGVKLDVEQVKLGGETAGGLKIDAERRAGAVRLTELKAGLPGGTRLDLSGDLKDENGKVSFAGSGFVRGSNLARLLTWAGKSGAQLDVNSDGPFSAEGRVLVNDARFELTEASAEIGGRPFSGDVVVSGNGRRRVAVTLEAARLDSRQLFPAMALQLEQKLRAALGLSSVTPPSDPNTPAEKPAAETGDISVRVLAGELMHGTQVFRNVDATVGLDGGNIRIPSARFTTASGLIVGLDASIDNSTDKPKGTLGYDVTASTREAAADLVSLTASTGIFAASRLSDLTNARLAGLIRLGARGDTAADVTIDGTLQSARIAGNAQFDGGLQGWRVNPSRVYLTARSANLGSLLTPFGIAPLAASADREAELTFASTGALATGAAAMLEIQAAGFEAAYSGQAAVPGDRPLSLAGTLTLKADEVGDALAMAGVTTAKGLAGIPIDGTIDLQRKESNWTLSSRKLALGKSVLSGTAELMPGPDGRTVATAALAADRIALPGLLAVISDKPLTSAATDDTQNADPWPQSSFSFDALNGVAATVDVRFASLEIYPGIAARDGAMKLALDSGKVAIESLTGRAAGGAVRAAMQLSKAPSGTLMDGSLTIDGADLAVLSPAARGKATLEVKAASQAQSAAALFAVMSGSGTLSLDDARLPAPNPSTGSEVVTAVFAKKVANDPDDISLLLRTALSASQANLGTRTIPVSITGGIAKLDPVTLESADGISTSITIADLTSLSIDSAWRLAVVVPPLPPPADPWPEWAPSPAKAPLPPVSIVYTGRAGDLASIATSVDVTEMQRELAVRQLERNVEELERMRLQDAYRQRLERERRQAIEAERAAAAAAARAAQPQSPPAATSQPAPLPPVIPESAGTPPATPPPAPEPPIDPSAAAPSPRTITIEPIPAPSPPVVAQPPIRPAGAPSASRPQPVRTAPVRPPPRRTTSDEVMRSLGGLP